MGAGDPPGVGAAPMKPRRLPELGRSARRRRDDRIFVIATEDTYAPKQYFEALSLPRVRVLILETRNQDSAPSQVVDRLIDAHRNARLHRQVQDEDEFWIIIDSDHHFQPNHCSGTIRSLDTARQNGFGIAVSNPCFEVWLLLHNAPLTLADAFSSPSAVEARLREQLGGYNKTKLPTTLFQISRLPDAIRHARLLETDPDDPRSYQPQNPGTRVYRILESILKSG